MLRRNIGILKKGYVADLVAADRGRRFIKNELFAREWPGADVEPPIFERAFYEAHGRSRSEAEHSQSEGTTGCALVKGHGDWIERQAPNKSSDRPAHHAKLGFLARLPA